MLSLPERRSQGGAECDEESRISCNFRARFLAAVRNDSSPTCFRSLHGLVVTMAGIGG